MSEKTLSNIIRAVCGVLVALPGTLALVPDLLLSPGQSAVFLVLSVVGATVLSQLAPAGENKGLPVNVADLTPEQRARLALRLQNYMKTQP